MKIYLSVYQDRNAEMMRQFFRIPYKIEEANVIDNVMDNEVECDVVITGETKRPKTKE